MKFRFRPFLAVCLLVGALLLISGCSGNKNPYKINNEDNYDISVRFDANGGYFTTNVDVMVDFFNPAELKSDSSGNVSIALLSPDDELRGNSNYFTPVLKDHFLVGWYAERTETADGGYSYAKKWDFSKDRLTVAADGEYNSTEPVMTLYAVWAPMFEVEFYDSMTGELMDTLTYDPTETGAAPELPEWNKKKGEIKMNDFPEKEGYTFNSAYYDAALTQPIETETLVHTGVLNEANGTVENRTMKVYLDWLEGEWYHIYTAKQFEKFAAPDCQFVICDDLDFSDEDWPEDLMHDEFTGTIIGNGHTIRNVTVAQTDMKALRSGLFGSVRDDAIISDLSFDNVNFTIQKGTKSAGANFGLFAGSISENAGITNVTISNSVLKIDSGLYYDENSDYIIGLVCAMGNYSIIDGSGITCEAAGFNPDLLTVTVSGNQVDIVKEF